MIVDTMSVTFTIGLAMGLFIGISIAMLVDKYSRIREKEIMENVKKYMEDKKNGRVGEENNEFI